MRPAKAGLRVTKANPDTMKQRIKPSGGRYDAPYTLKETAQVVGCSWQHVQHLEVTALQKIIAGLKEKGVSNQDFVDAFRQGLLAEIYEEYDHA